MFKRTELYFLCDPFLILENLLVQYIRWLSDKPNSMNPDWVALPEKHPKIWSIIVDLLGGIIINFFNPKKVQNSW